MLSYDFKVFHSNQVETFCKILCSGRRAYVRNVVYDTSPLIIHANGVIKPFIDTLGNYIPNAWNPKDGCTACLERTINMSNFKVRLRYNSTPNKLSTFFNSTGIWISISVSGSFCQEEWNKFWQIYHSTCYSKLPAKQNSHFPIQTGNLSFKCHAILF